MSLSHNVSLSLHPAPCTPSPRIQRESAPSLTLQILRFPSARLPAPAPRLPCSPQAASTTEHQMGWHRLASWPNGCLFKHWSCLHCRGSLHVKHSPLKPYANPIKVSAVRCGEAITLWSQVCLLSSRKGNLIEQLKGKSDSAQHHVEDTRLNGSQVCGGQREINDEPGELWHIVKRALSQPVSNPGPPPLPETPPVLPLQAPFSSFLSSFFFIPRGVLIYFFNDKLPSFLTPSTSHSPLIP